jgi:elongation of very long chain fatty acids protein 7
MSSPLPTISIIALYLYFVKNLGPALMRDRKPFELKRVLTVYNLFQVAGNLINVSICLHAMLAKDLTLDWLCMLPPWGDTSDAYRIVTKCSYFYYILKITDLLDTVRVWLQFVTF